VLSNIAVLRVGRLTDELLGMWPGRGLARVVSNRHTGSPMSTYAHMSCACLSGELTDGSVGSSQEPFTLRTTSSHGFMGLTRRAW
jgi:hypothetical protein